MKKTEFKSVLITGASSGIGEALSHVFTRHGYDLILVARRAQVLEKLKLDLEKKSSSKIAVIALDLSKAGSAEQLMHEIERLNLRVDILVNNAGIGMYGPFADSDWENCERMLSLNMMNLAHLTRLCLGPMRQRKFGRILNLASTAAFQPGPLMSLYYASKAFVLHFSEGLASELEGTGLTVTALCPGPTLSGFQEEAKLNKSGLMRLSFQTSEAVAEYGFHALMQGKVVAVSGLLNRVMVASVRITPRFLIRKILKKLMSPLKN